MAGPETNGENLGDDYSAYAPATPAPSQSYEVKQIIGDIARNEASLENAAETQIAGVESSPVVEKINLSQEDITVSVASELDRPKINGIDSDVYLGVESPQASASAGADRREVNQNPILQETKIVSPPTSPPAQENSAATKVFDPDQAREAAMLAAKRTTEIEKSALGIENDSSSDQTSDSVSNGLAEPKSIFDSQSEVKTVISSSDGPEAQTPEPQQVKSAGLSELLNHEPPTQTELPTERAEAPAASPQPPPAVEPLVAAESNDVEDDSHPTAETPAVSASVPNESQTIIAGSVPQVEIPASTGHNDRQPSVEMAQLAGDGFLGSLLDFRFEKFVSRQAMPTVYILGVAGIVMATITRLASLLDEYTSPGANFGAAEILSLMLTPFLAIVFVVGLRVILEVISATYERNDQLRQLASGAGKRQEQLIDLSDSAPAQTSEIGAVR